MKSEISGHIINGLVVFLFLYAGISKVLEHVILHQSFTAFPIIKYGEPVISWLLPGIEIGTAILLIIPAYKMAGLFMALTLLLLFTGYLIMMAFSGVHLPCSCGGFIKFLSWKQHIFFNLSFILIIIRAILFIKKKKLQKSDDGFYV